MLLNRAKSAEIIFTDSKRQTNYILPPPILGISLSMGEHVHDVVGKCAQSLYALKLLRNHGMSDESLTLVYKAVVLSKLLHAAPAWWGFTSAADKQRLQASIRRLDELYVPACTRPTILHFYRAIHFSAKRGIAIACRLSVTLVNCHHIGWNSSKLISPLVSLGCSLFATPT